MNEPIAYAALGGMAVWALSRGVRRLGQSTRTRTDARPDRPRVRVRGIDMRERPNPRAEPGTDEGNAWDDATDPWPECEWHVIGGEAVLIDKEGEEGQFLKFESDDHALTAVPREINDLEADEVNADPDPDAEPEGEA